jgi:hypothetical protein
VKSRERLELYSVFVFAVFIFLSSFSFAQVNSAPAPDFHSLIMKTTTVYQSSAVAAGLIKVSNTEIIFEGDVDGDGVVDSVRYRLVDSAGNSPPTGTCPCTIQRSQKPKVSGTNPGSQPTSWSQELQNVGPRFVFRKSRGCTRKPPDVLF